MILNEITIIIGLLLVHFIGDFVFQSDEMAKGKSTDNSWLGFHCLVYASTLFVLSPTTNLKLMASFALFNGITHFCIDYVTSRINKRLWAEGRTHDFFVCVGFDQWLHTTLLIGSWFYLCGVFK